MLNVLRLLPPGRFPTVVPDPGAWVERLHVNPAVRLRHYSANVAFWRALCSPSFPTAMLATLPFSTRIRHRIKWLVHRIDLERTGCDAIAALDAFSGPQAFTAAEPYLHASEMLAIHLDTIERVQPGFSLSLFEGPIVTAANYDDSASLVAYARNDNPLRRLIAASLQDAPAADIVLVTATSAQELLTALICVDLMRVRMSDIYACLIDHGYENYSLSPHLDLLRDAGTLDSIFDSIIESKDERDDLVPFIVERVAVGRPPRGYLRLIDLDSSPPRDETPPQATPLMPTFCGEPVLATRVSQRRCYWSRCTFCTQNAKYDNQRAPSRADIDSTLNRLAINIAAGYRHVLFQDEALSPAMLQRLCRGILDRGLEFRWACRCKLELAHTEELFTLMRQAGCFEVLIGLETVSAELQRAMDKHVEGLDRQRIRGILQAASSAGIGLYVSLIGGFPGDTPKSLKETTDFLIDALKNADNATYRFNSFTLFPDTPLASVADKYGIVVKPPAGDMPSALSFALVGPQAHDTMRAAALVPAATQHADGALGWDRLGQNRGAELARYLYFSTGHGALFKAAPENPFVNPLRTPVTATMSVSA